MATRLPKESKDHPSGASPSWTPGKAIRSRRVHPPQKEFVTTRVPQVRSARITKGTQNPCPSGKVPRDHEEGVKGWGEDTAGEIQAMIGPTSEKYAHMSNREVPRKDVVESRQGSDTHASGSALFETLTIIGPTSKNTLT